MKITIADKFIAYLALLSGLTISAVAIWYSVAGLVSIFAAAVVPIIVMGVVLEISKLIATVWLKLNWHRAPIFIRSYLIGAIAILMVITSMGIFGFLSKAHSDQSLVSGDVQSKIAVYDEKIKTAKDNIDANRKALKQMDEAVDQVMGRSQDEKGADKAVALRRGQAKERTRLLSEITAEQKTIAQLSEERAPIAAEVRKVEAEVGPIKYIANFIYGDNPDANVLEKAVTWVIIIIVAVFDPLAVILLLASQYSFQWFRQAKEEQEQTPDPYVPDVGEKPTPEELDDDPEEPCPKCGTSMLNAPGIGVYCPNKECDVLDNPNGYLAEQEAKKDEFDISKHAYLNQPFAHFKNLQPMVYKPEPEKQTMLSDIQPETITDDEIELELDEGLKAAKQQWKAENPNDTIKHQEKLYEMGMIDTLPWDAIEMLDQKKSEEASTTKLSEVMDQNPMSLNFELNFENSTATNLEESKKKSSYMIKDQNQQVKKTKE